MMSTKVEEMTESQEEATMVARVADKVAKLAKVPKEEAEPIENEDIKFTDPELWSQMEAKLKGTEIFHAFSPKAEPVAVHSPSTTVYSETMRLEYDEDVHKEDLPMCLLWCQKPKMVSLEPSQNHLVVAKEGIIMLRPGADGKQAVDHIRWRQVKQVRVGKEHVVVVGEKVEGRKLKLVEEFWPCKNPLGLTALLSVYKLQSNEVENVEGTTINDFLQRAV